MMSLKSKFLYLIITVVLIFTGCSDEGKEAATLFSDELSCASLRISAKADFSKGLTKYESESLGGNFTHDLRFFNVIDVCINIEGNTIPLAQALQENYITEEEIFCYARLDARNGFCQEEVESKNGLTHFTYRYPDCNIRLIYDVYEAPDGQQHLICDMAIYPHGMILGPYTDFLSYETSEYLDREDWGLTLESANAEASSLTIQCRQEGGQQLGQLKIYQYLLSSEKTSLARLDGNHTVSHCDYVLKMGAQSQLTIDWREHYGELPSGSYTITLFIRDEYDHASIHPLMRNYYDEQIYQIDFTIP